MSAPSARRPLHPMRRRRSTSRGAGTFSRLLSGLLFAALVAGGVAVAGPAAPAHAAASVEVHVDGSPELTGVADPTYLTKLRVTGSGFQSIKNGFGGIYVMFGWVDDGWRPSQGGVTGADYRYVPDDEDKPTGYISFVAFPGSSTSYAANGGEVDAAGRWSAVLDVPGATFTSLDRDGKPGEVDCRVVQCGVITIGAHGVKNANNETFTPITFRDLYGEDTPTSGGTKTPSAAPTPAPTHTTIVVEEITPAAAPVAATEASDTTELLSILLWAVLGVGILAVLAIAFLVWAVLSQRRRTREATDKGGV
ncbi:hypothetical protein [Microbacterium sp. TNHR37B]|uniref:hypothetical protein n=1 Tax=Microbacterium sp. TNHR37B TaxID=1775956 RepID=UPI0007B2B032|nr:hypothetical protein [Microbacterium sp. TNHR37B]KZE89590.1 hypothetical protein AVP41_02388 [Microbacterium sp. TNHR37B]